MKSWLYSILKKIIPKGLRNKIKNFNIFNKQIIQLFNLFVQDSINYKNVILPAKRLRFCGQEFQDEEFYLTSAQSEAVRLVEHLGLTLNSCVLDVGCGQGRLAIGLYSKIGEIQCYRGFDVDRNSIRWCQRYITRYHPNYKFLYGDLKSSRYNPLGKSIKYDFRLPFNDQKFDVIYLYSVFSHMTIEDIKVYLKEFYRILAPSGKIFLTAFIEEGVPNISVNPPDFMTDWGESPLHCVRYDKIFFEKILAQFNFIIDKFDYKKETNGQSGIYLSKK